MDKGGVTACFVIGIGRKVSVLLSTSSHKRRKCLAYDVYEYDERIIYL
jgi:hypothetical protein